MVQVLLERHTAKLRALFWLVLFATVALALLPMPAGLPVSSLGDKVNHMIAFATLAALGSIAFAGFPPLRLVERLVFLGAGIEVVQSIPALNRDCDALDWLADTLAVVVVVALFAAWRAVRPSVEA